MANNPIAGSSLVGSFTPTVLLAGDADIVTGAASSLVAAFAQYEVAALTDTGVTTYVTGTHTPDQAVIVLHPITSGTGKQINYVSSGGVWNHAVLTWPAAVSTFALRKSFAQKTKFMVDQVQLQGNPSWAA